MTTARLMLAGGSGRLARRPSVLLFDPTGGNQELASRFDEAPTDIEAIEGVKKHLIESGFSAAPLVAVSWDQQQLDLLIFGDVAIHSSAAAAPMVSGAGSASWVERRVGEIERGAESSIELWGGEVADPTTNLGLGVVACAGFRLSLNFAAVDGNPLPPVAAAAPQVAAATVPEPAAPEPVTPEPAAPEPVIPEPVTPEPVRPPRPAPPAPPVVEEDPTIGEPGVEEDPFSGQSGEPPSRVGLIEAAHCQEGHANPPRSAACYRCGISLIDDQSLSLIEQPTVGRIAFPGGQSVVLDRDLELGRKPTPADRVHPVIIDHAEVSRSHASLKVEGWTVLLTDLSSRNGTWVVPPNDVTPVRLDAEVAHVLEHGTRVHVGGPEVAFTYLFDAQDE